jgi:O-antigen ligase
MPENFRALFVVVALAMPAFYISRRIAGSVIAHREFSVWRNAWFIVTVAEFLFGNFFVFAAMIVVTCLYALSIRAATVGLFFVLLFVAPLIAVPIGGLGIVNELIDINNARLLAIVLLLPILFVTGGVSRRNRAGYVTPDRLVVGYVLLMIALEFRRSEITNVMRVATQLTLDVLIPYWACSRAVTSVADFRKVLLAFVIAVIPLSLIAVFETTRGWLLYNSVDWGMVDFYALREGMLRASASSGSSIVLGYILMVGIGFMLAIRQMILPRIFGAIVLAILTAGLVATLSRGPWVGASVLILAFLVTGPNSVANLGMFILIGAVALAFLLLTPVGERLLDFLPFIGSVDANSVVYRMHLFENAIEVIQHNLWFGSVDYLSTREMQELRQGQGIIDIVNTYLRVTLNYGLVGLTLFLGIFGTILIGLRRVLKFEVIQDIGFKVYVRASMATLIAILVTLGTVSSTEFIPYVYWSVAGLCVALIRIAYRERAAVTRATNLLELPV